MPYIPRPQHEAIRNALHRYAWPGGYPVYLVAAGGGVLCSTCVQINLRLIIQSTHDHANRDWQALGADVNWEDPNLTCDNCGERIESAYAEDEVTP
jgi:hypothetical protein